MNPPPCGSPPTRVGTTVFGCACADGCYGSLPTRVGLLRCHRRESYRFTPTRVRTTATPTAPPGSLSGSPPRAWGQLCPAVLRRANLRFTPTRVGTTTAISRPIRHSPVHPHARGDNARHDHPDQGELGSPPRAWGQQVQADIQPRRPRFTPTRVGTTTKTCACPQGRPVHPHARGDNMATSGSLTAATGSPPRAWGQL